jgi:hypothetical protein
MVRGLILAIALVATGEVRAEPSSTLISHPEVIIWLSNDWLKASFQTFSSYAIQSSEQAMKEFVNDWTASQKTALDYPILRGEG